MPFVGHGKLANSWWGATAPATNVVLSALTYIGMGFKFTVPGRVNGFRVWVPSGVSQVFWGILWNQSSNHLLRAYHFRDDVTLPSNDWMNTWFRPWLRINTTDTYRLVVLQGTDYHRNTAALTVPVTHNGIQFISGFQTTSIAPTTAAITTNTNANGVDVLFQAD